MLQRLYLKLKSSLVYFAGLVTYSMLYVEQKAYGEGFQIKYGVPQPEYGVPVDPIPDNPIVQDNKFGTYLLIGIGVAAFASVFVYYIIKRMLKKRKIPLARNKL